MARSHSETQKTQKQNDNSADSLSSPAAEQLALFEGDKQSGAGTKTTESDEAEKLPLSEEGMQGWSSTKVIGIDGKVIPDCYIAGDQELLDKALKLEDRYVRESYWLRPDVKVDVNDLTEYLALEKRQARRTTAHLLKEGVIPKNAPSAMPVVYSPDSGLHTAEGVMDSLFHASNLDTKRIAAEGDVLPQEAIDMAKESGVLVYCDSVAYSGESSKALLEKIPKDLQGPDGKPIKVITYFNFVYNVDESKNSPQPNKLKQPEMLRGAAAPHQVYFIVNSVGGQEKDLFDRADGMAKLAATNDKLRPYTDKFLKPEKHYVGQHQNALRSIKFAR